MTGFSSPFSSNAIAVKQSHWVGLNPSLIASIYPVDRKGNRIGDVVVRCPFSEGTSFDFSLSWTSSFENSGVDQKAPALLGMMQAGTLNPLIQAVGDFVGGKSSDFGMAKGVSQKANEFISKFEGRTGQTKLNSTQIFTGMQPIKISATAVFRAWADAGIEVESPVWQLVSWSLPELLSSDGSIIARGINSSSSEKNGIDAAIDVLLPSIAPTLIAIEYKGKKISPLVIESIQVQDAPTDALGRMVKAEVPMTICSISAMDREDLKSWAMNHLNFK